MQKTLKEIKQKLLYTNLTVHLLQHPLDRIGGKWFFLSQVLNKNKLAV
jgi:hypothetical protein